MTPAEKDFKNEVIGEIDVVRCNFHSADHCRNLVRLTNIFMTDPEMGCGRKLAEAEEENLISGLAEHPATFILFATYQGKYVGLITCFIGFSTFKAQKLIHIHDVVVDPEFRGLGIAKKLIKTVEETAIALKYCKITIEIKADNKIGKKLYQGLNLGESSPPVSFWSKDIDII